MTRVPLNDFPPIEMTCYMRFAIFLAAIFVSRACCASDFISMKDFLMRNINEREKLDKVHIEVSCSSWDSTSNNWNAVGTAGFWRNGDQHRWEKINADGTKTVEIWDGNEFWSHQTKVDGREVAASHELALENQKPTTLMLGYGIPHVFLGIEDFKKGSFVFQLINLMDNQIDSCVFSPENGAKVVLNSNVIVELHFAPSGTLRLAKIVNTDLAMESIVESQLTTYTHQQHEQIFPSQVQFTIKKNGAVTSIVKAEVSVFEDSNKSAAFFSKNELGMPVGHQVNDLVVSNVGHWDGTKVVLPDTGLPSGEPSKRRVLIGLALLLCSLTIGIYVWVRKSRRSA